MKSQVHVNEVNSRGKVWSVGVAMQIWGANWPMVGIRKWVWSFQRLQTFKQIRNWNQMRQELHWENKIYTKLESFFWSTKTCFFTFECSRTLGQNHNWQCVCLQWREQECGSGGHCLKEKDFHRNRNRKWLQYKWINGTNGLMEISQNTYWTTSTIRGEQRLDRLE